MSERLLYHSEFDVFYEHLISAYDGKQLEEADIAELYSKLREFIEIKSSEYSQELIENAGQYSQHFSELASTYALDNMKSQLNDINIYEIICNYSFAILLQFDTYLEREKDDIDNFDKVLWFLAREAWENSMQILIIIKGGFITGAFSILRTLYEYYVITKLIDKKGVLAAEAYYLSGYRDYEWARNCMCVKENERITFKKIRKECYCNSDDENKLFDICSRMVHATSFSTITSHLMRNENEEFEMYDNTAKYIIINSARMLFNVIQLRFKDYSCELPGLWLEILNNLLKQLK